MDNPNINLTTKSRLVIVHPQASNRLAYLAQALEIPYARYHRFTGTDLTLSQATAQLSQNYVRGEATNCLILDECDRLSSTALSGIINNLYNDFFITQIIIFSRRLPATVYQNTVLQQTTHIISPEQMPIETTAPQIEAYGFGIGTIWLNGQQLTFASDEQKEFMFYTLNDKTFLREDVLNNLGSLQALPRPDALAQFNALRAGIRDLLGFDWLVQTGAMFQHNPSVNIQYDVQKYRDLVSAQNMKLSTNLTAVYAQAFRLFRNTFLTSLNTPWVRSARSLLQQEQASVCTHLAEDALAQSALLEAITLYAQALKYHPFREDIAEIIMDQYLALGMPCDALATFNTLRDNRYRAGIRNCISITLMQLAKDAIAQCPNPFASP